MVEIDPRDQLSELLERVFSTVNMTRKFLAIYLLPHTIDSQKTRVNLIEPDSEETDEFHSHATAPALTITTNHFWTSAVLNHCPDRIKSL